MKIVNWLSKQSAFAAACALAVMPSACSGEFVEGEAFGDEATGAEGAGEQSSELARAKHRVAACTPQQQPIALATASTQQAAGFGAQYAIDGDPSTRWSSNTDPDQSLTLDLGKLVNVSALSINWETAFSRAYRVEWSTDGVIWDPFIFAGATGPGLQRVAGFARTRYVRVHSTVPTDWRSISIIDVQVIGTLDESCRNLLGGTWSLTGDDVEPPTFDVSSLYSVTDAGITFAYQGKPFTVIGAPPLGLHFSQPVPAVRRGRYRLRLDVTNVSGATTTMFHARLNTAPASPEGNATPWSTIWTLSRPGGFGSAIIEMDVSPPPRSTPIVELVSTPNTVFPGVGVQDFKVTATLTQIN